MKNWVKRSVSEFLLKKAKERPAIALVGARQTGKTSLIKQLFPKHHYITLDLPSEAEQAEKDPQSFLLRHPAPLIIDEAQYAPGLFRYLKVEIDNNRAENGRYILTGSQKFSLMKGATESLAGRIEIVELESLSFEEVKKSAASINATEYCLRGGMPELWEKPDMETTGFFSSYVATYLERDLRSLLDVGSLRDFERFVRACALRSAQVLNKAELARDVGISPSTAGIWISVLEASNQIILLEPWFSNGTKRLTKSPKIYMADSGLLCFLLGIYTPNDLTVSPHAGAIWETTVYAELRKKMRLNPRGDLFYWRDSTKEADFLIHRGGFFEILDAKWHEHPLKRESKNLIKVMGEFTEEQVLRGALICRTPNAYPVEGKLQAVPLDMA